MNSVNNQLESYLKNDFVENVIENPRLEKKTGFVLRLFNFFWTYPEKGDMKRKYLLLIPGIFLFFGLYYITKKFWKKKVYVRAQGRNFIQNLEIMTQITEQQNKDIKKLNKIRDDYLNKINPKIEETKALIKYSRCHPKNEEYKELYKYLQTSLLFLLELRPLFIEDEREKTTYYDENTAVCCEESKEIFQLKIEISSLGSEIFLNSEILKVGKKFSYKKKLYDTHDDKDLLKEKKQTENKLDSIEAHIKKLNLKYKESNVERSNLRRKLEDLERDKSNFLDEYHEKFMSIMKKK